MNKDWEKEISHITNLVNELELGNKSKCPFNSGLRDHNERLKEENEYYRFKLKIAEEKEKIHETNVNSLKELQFEYEEQKRSLQTEYKSKEEKLKKRYEDLENNSLIKLKEKEGELISQLTKLSDDHNTLAKAYDRLERENYNMKETILKHDKLIKIKEDEFEQLLDTKETRLKELELYIRSISEEANLQITKLTNSINEFTERINLYKVKENEMNLEMTKLQKQNEHNDNLEINKSREIIFAFEMKINALTEEIGKLNKTLNEQNKIAESHKNELNVKLFLIIGTESKLRNFYK
jgi:chromosome segregation ATPase